MSVQMGPVPIGLEPSTPSPPRLNPAQGASSTPTTVAAEHDRSSDFEDTKGSWGDSSTDREASLESVIVVSPEIKKMTPGDALRWAIADLAACGQDVLDEAMEEAINNVGTQKKDASPTKREVEKDFCPNENLKLAVPTTAESKTPEASHSKVLTKSTEPAEIQVEPDVGVQRPSESLAPLSVEPPSRPLAVVQPLEKKLSVLPRQGWTLSACLSNLHLSRRHLAVLVGTAVFFVVVAIIIWLLTKDQNSHAYGPHPLLDKPGQPLRWKDLMRMVAAEKASTETSVSPLP